ncbi:MAG: hypothetical protein ACRD8A_01420 [Candidatus Acidiferrales bacterium]
MGDELAVPVHRVVAEIETISSPAATTVRTATFKDRSLEERHRLFRLILKATDFLTLITAFVILYCAAWAYSTQRYVDAFSDAIVPVSGSPEQKIEAILDWMAHPPARLVDGIIGTPNDRNPIHTLNYEALLQVCGTATNAFINLADTSSLRARRLLLLDAHGGTKHVDAEVKIGGKWWVIDPTFRVILRGSDGGMLTRRQLRNPAIFAVATRTISRYDPNYNFERTAHIRVAAIPAIGNLAGKALDSMLPGWQDSAAVSLIVERNSLLALTASLIAALLLVLLHLSVRLYGKQRLGIQSPGTMARLYCAVRAFMNSPNNAT